ncbi:phosphatidylglycerophosphatase B [Vibrio sagamiensis NBRC 104589]|uniref:undecaprenyl-diphosphate phosphatase n=2 Tax=Vibrio sagamiensis TaxID=512650 RepID=A0A511QJS5_9VIBR|nr:phosphatidylglycerophosphatase B [Vibrio sagamiensis NBRC 104589]
MLALFTLIIILLSLLIPHYDLTSQVSRATGQTIALLTNSAGSQGFLLTLIALLIALSRMHSTKTLWIKQLPTLGLLLVLGFAGKTGLKLITESPRPYTELLAAEQLIEQPQSFYQLSTNQQSDIIARISVNVSEWRTQHWQGEKDYSFPSGHTIFVAICLVFFGSLFLQAGSYLSAAVLLLWATSVAFSRLWLGMHRVEDLIGSVAFVAVLYCLIPLVYLTKNRPFLKIGRS